MPLINGLHFWAVVQTPHIVYENSFHAIFDSGAPTTAGGADSLANAIKAQLGPLYAGLLHEAAALTHVKLRYIAGGTDLEGISNTTPDEGTTVDAVGHGILPDEVCLCIQRRTGQAGRSKRGRIFLSGLPSTAQDHSHLADTYAAEALALAGWMAADPEISFTENGSGVTPVMHMRHWDKKNNVLLPINVARPLAMLMSRRDRRGQGQGLVVTYEE